MVSPFTTDAFETAADREVKSAFTPALLFTRHILACAVPANKKSITIRMNNFFIL
jgi:hypothetical protein